MNDTGGCWYGKYPKECETSPDIECERGQDIGPFLLIVGLTQIFLYFIFPPSVILAMHCWIQKLQRKIEEDSNSVHQVRQAARKEMIQCITKQLTLYLLAFWSTFILGLILNAHRLLSGGKMLYNLNIVTNCVYAFQGFVFMLVYFRLEKMGRHKPQFDSLESALANRSTYDESRASDLTFRVRRRSSLLRKSNDPEERVHGIGYTRRRAPKINIFDGTPYRDSPWAKFIEEYDLESVLIERNEKGIFICTELIHMENEFNDLHVKCTV